MLKKKKKMLPEIMTLGNHQQDGIKKEERQIEEPKLFLPQKREAIKLKINLIETEKNLRLLCNLPGVSPENLRVFINKQVVHILCRIDQAFAGEKNSKSHYNERLYGRLERVILLPALIEMDSAQGVLKNGVLDLNFTKTEMREPVELEIDYQLKHYEFTERK